MLQLTPHHSIHVAIDSIDFRKGINGLVAICQQHLRQEPCILDLVLVALDS